MTLDQLQALAPTIAGQRVQFHSCVAQGEGYAVLWAWGDSLAESHYPAGTMAQEVVTALVALLTPPEIVVKAEDGTVIRPDGSTA